LRSSTSASTIAVSVGHDPAGGIAQHPIPNYVMAGFNSGGTLLAPGAGMTIAEWMVNGRPHIYFRLVNIDRMMPFQTNPL
jgi:glycine/D-amino acid oxidase-like deaminating enzyme